MKRKKKYKTRTDWTKVKHDYLFKNMSLESLAEKYGVSKRQVFKHSSDENWVELKEQKNREISEKTQKELKEKEIARRIAANEKHIELYDDGIVIVEEILKMYKSTMSDTKKKKKVNPFNLEKIFSCIEKAQKGQRLALNMEKEEVTDNEPKFVMVENLDLNKL